MSLTPRQLEQIAERTRAECEAQGLPEVVEDPVTLAKVARLSAPATDEPKDAA